MSKMAGVVLILSGLAVAVYGLSSEEEANGSDAARLVEVAKNPIAAATDTASGSSTGKVALRRSVKVFMARRVASVHAPLSSPS